MKTINNGSFKMDKKYYTLLSKFEGSWYVEFGDYDYKDVEIEKGYMQDEGLECKILVTGESQKAIDLAVLKLNENNK